MTHPLPEGIVLRRLSVADADELAPLNDAASPAVPITDATALAELVSIAALPLALERDGALVGFLIALAPGADYDSENYRYFSSRATPSLYVDRIVIAESERGKRLGQVLYAEVFAEAARRALPEVTCEVNLDPPNPGSLAFHRRLGFTQVGEQPTKGGSVTVALLAASVPPAAA